MSSSSPLLAVILVLGSALLLPLASGCSKDELAGQCATTLEALNVGADSVSAPTDEAARKAQLAKMQKAVEKWSTSQNAVTLPDLRDNADALAAAVTERKSLLAKATFGSAGTHGLDARSQSALDANNKAYQSAMGAVTKSCAPK